MNDDALLSIPGTVWKMLDTACETGGMLAEAVISLSSCTG